MNGVDYITLQVIYVISCNRFKLLLSLCESLPIDYARPSLLWTSLSIGTKFTLP